MFECLAKSCLVKYAYKYTCRSAQDSGILRATAMTHLHRRTVTMLAIVTVWMTWHVATSSPAGSIVWCANG